MTLYDAIADLPLRIEDVDLARRERETPAFTRVTTLVSLRGPKDDSETVTGTGEDVTYDTEDHDALQNWDGTFDLAGEYTLRSFSVALDDVDLFPAGEPGREDFRHYRRWGFESAALDLALRQADSTLAAELDRRADPVRFVASSGLGDPPSLDRVESLLDANPGVEFKLDPTSAWTDEIVEELAALDSVRILDLKGLYEGTEVDQPGDPDLYKLVLDGFPDAIVEDPALTEETQSLFEGHEDRISWDYPIVDVASIRDLPFEPRWLNSKPSRFGSLENLLDAIEYCEDHEIQLYGGGQFELDVGRGQIQELAATFYPDGPNDVAPRAYNDPEPSPPLPVSPIEPPEAHTGFGW